MSNARTHRRARQRQATRMDPDAVRTAIALTSAVRGCTCQPNVVHRGLVVRIEHDDWCPASDTGQALVIAPKRARTPKET